MTNIPSTMRAIVLTGHGGMDKLEYHTDWPVPQPAASEVLVKVAACGMNNTDVNTRSGWYAKSVTEATTGDAYDTVSDEDDGGWDGGISFPLIQGGDVAGTVAAVGAGVDSSLIGKRSLVDTVLRDWDEPMNLHKTGYLGSAKNGGFSEYMVIDHRNINPINTDWSDAELATIAIAYSTAENMLVRAGVDENDTVLVPGASGGVGSALIQLAKRRGAKTIALASEAKHAEVGKLSPTVLLPRQPDDLAAAIKGATGKDKVTVVADIVGGDQFPNILEMLDRGGRYTCSGAIAGPIVDLDLRTMYLNDLTFFGNTIFQPNVFPNLVTYIENDEIVPMLAASYPLEDFHAGQEAFIEKKHTGNIVVTM